MSPALSRCECSANIAMFVSHPAGLREPLERGQSGNAIPAPMLVVNAPRATRTNTQAAATAENAARPGFRPAVRGRSWVVAMRRADGPEKLPCCQHQTL